MSEAAAVSNARAPPVMGRWAVANSPAKNSLFSRSVLSALQLMSTNWERIRSMSFLPRLPPEWYRISMMSGSGAFR